MLKGRPISLTKEETIAFLKSNPAVRNESEIFYSGRWLQLCRTDLKDDVVTSPAIKFSSEVTLEKLIPTVVYGARITDDYFAIIDSYSDG